MWCIFSEDVEFKPIPGRKPDLVLLDSEDNEVEVRPNEEIFSRLLHKTVLV